MLAVSISGPHQDWRQVFKVFYELLREQSPSCGHICLSNDIFALSFTVLWHFSIYCIVWSYVYKLNP